MRTVISLAAGLALLAAPGCEPRGPAAGAPPLPAKELKVAMAKAGLPADDPVSPLWEQAREVVVPLLPQDVVEPRLTEKGVESLRLRALHDGARVAFRLEWEDAGPDALVDLDRATDAAAIELPATGEKGGLPDSMMGERGKPVLIALWRFASQERAAGRPHGIAALYPNAAIDHYPYEATKDEAARAEMERRFAPARAAENPTVASRARAAVEDLEAEGYGTLAPTREQRSTGVGVHAEGRWRVVIARPLDLAAGSETVVRPGASTFVAVAVWNGARGEVGARKMRSIWVPVEVEGARP